MTPSLHELGAVPGESVRVKKEILTEGSNPRQCFRVDEAPVFPKFGRVVLKSLLTGEEITTMSTADSLIEKVKY